MRTSAEVGGANGGEISFDDGAVMTEARSRLQAHTRSATAAATLNTIIKKYKDGADKIEAEAATNESNRRLASRFLGVISDIPGVVGTGTLGAAAEDYFDGVQREIDTRREALVGDVVIGGLQKMKQVDPGAFGGLGADSANAFIDKLLDPDVINGDPRLRETLQGVGIQALRSMIAESETRAQVNLDNAIAQLTEVDNAIKKSVDRVQADVKTLRDAFSGLSKSVDQLSDKVADNTNRLGDLEGVVWGKMSAAERAEALRGGKFATIVSTMTPAERKTYLAGLEKYARVQEAVETVGTVSQVANDLASLPGLRDIPAIREAASAASKAAALSQAALSIYSGGPIGVLSGVAGISRVFGGGGGDATASQLAQISEQIQEMRKEMRTYHETTMKALDALSAQVDDSFRKTWDLQGLTLRQIEFNTRQLTELLSQSFGRCELVLARWDGLGSNVNYDSRVDVLNASPHQDFVDCRQGILNIFQSAGGSQKYTVSSVFSIRAQKLDGQMLDQDGGVTNADAMAITRYLDHTYAPMLAYTRNVFARSWGQCRFGMSAIAALAGAGDQQGEVRQRLEASRASCGAPAEPQLALYRAGPPQQRDYLLDDLVAPSAVAKFSGIAVDYAPMYELLNASTDPSLLNKSAILRGESPGPAATIETLRLVRNVLDVAIAQQNILLGDLVMPELQRALEWGSQQAPDVLRKLPAASVENLCVIPGATDEAAYANAVCILKANPLLRANFSFYWLKSRLAKPQYITLLAGGMASDTREMIDGALTAKLPLKYKAAANGRPAHWVFEYAAPGQEAPETLPLPNWKIVNGKPYLDTGPSYRALQELRLRIDVMLLDLEFTANLTPAQIAVLRDSYLALGGALRPGEEDAIRGPL